MAQTADSKKIVIKGKYIQVIERYVSTLVLDKVLIPAWNPELEALRDAVVKLHGKYLSKSDVLSILISLCIEFAADHQDRIGPLSDTQNADLHAELVSRIKIYLESIPQSYTLKIGLPSFPRWGAAVYQLSPDVRLVIGEAMPQGEHLKSRGLLGAGLPPPYDDLSTFIEVTISGYSDWTPDSPGASACLSIAKQCAFILYSYGTCKLEWQQWKARSTLTANVSGITKELVLPDSIARCFGQLVPNEEKLIVYDMPVRSLLTDTGRPAVTREEKSKAFGANLSGLTRFFQAQSYADFDSIAAAIEWYQDSRFADNQTFSYIAACIGLEAVLGSDANLDSMSKRLADRYAFLLGKGRSDRERMVTEYTNVLNLRGRLVHSKAARLRGDDIQLLYKAQDMLLKVIWHDLQSLYRAQDSEHQNNLRGLFRHGSG